MLSIIRITPDPLLSGVVRDYQARSGQAPPGGRLLPLMATTETRLHFYFTRATTLESRRTGHLSAVPTTALIGPRTRRQHDLRMDGMVDILSVQFEATGLHALLGISMPALADWPCAPATYRNGPELSSCTSECRSATARTDALWSWRRS